MQIDLNSHTMGILDKELSLFYSPNRLKLRLDTFNSKESIRRIINHLNKFENGLVSLPMEVFDDNQLDILREYILKYNSNFKIQCTTCTEVEMGTLPYTNYAVWHDIGFADEDTIISNDLTEEHKYSLFKYNLVGKKEVPYIISARKRNASRYDLYNSIIDITNYNGIVRYDDTIEGISNELQIGSYINAHQLLSEYDSTYISFVLETVYNGNRYVGECINLTEKTPIAIHTNTMPIILGNKSLNSKIVDMGFWTLNNHFNFDDTSDISEKELFHIFKKINNTDIDEIKELYTSNINNIHNNKEIQQFLFNKAQKYKNIYIYNKHIHNG